MDKDKEIQLLSNETFMEIMKHQRQTLEGYKKICLACLATVVLSITIMCGSAIYFFANYEAEIIEETTTTYEQQSDGESQIINGTSYNDNSIHNAKGD